MSEIRRKTEEEDRQGRFRSKEAQQQGRKLQKSYKKICGIKKKQYFCNPFRKEAARVRGAEKR